MGYRDHNLVNKYIEDGYKILNYRILDCVYELEKDDKIIELCIYRV